MKVDDLVQKINVRTGFKAIKERDYIEIRTDYDDDLMEIKNNAESIDDSGILYRYLDECGDGCRKLSRFYALLNLINEFVNTPVKDRFPERKYYLCVFPKKEALKQRGESEGVWVNQIGSFDDGFRIDYGPKTAFTEETLNTIKESLPFIAPAIDTMKVEAKDNAC